MPGRYRISTLFRHPWTATFAGRGSAAAALAVNTVVVARALSPGEFGRFFLASTIAVAAGLIATGGTNRVLLRSIAARGDDSGTVLRQRDGLLRILRISLPAGSVLGGLIAYGFFGRGDVAATVALLAAANALQSCFGDALRGFEANLLASIVEGRSGGGIALAAHTVLLLPFLGGRPSLLLVLGLNVLAFVPVVALSHLALRRPWASVRSSAQAASHPARLEMGPPLGRQASTFLAIQLLAFAATQSEIFIAGIALTDREIAALGASLRVVALVSLPVIAAHLALTPTVAALHASGKRAALERSVRRTSFFVGVPSVAVGVLLLLFPRLVVELLFGDAYTGAAAMLPWLVLGHIANALTGAGGVVLPMTGHEDESLMIMAATTILKVGTGIPVAYVVGGVGLAVVVGIAAVFLNVAQLLVVRWRIGIWALPAIAPRAASVTSATGASR